jgi:hypothetical protein
MMAEEEYGSRLVCVRLCCRISILTEFFLWELGYPAPITSGSSTLRGELGAILFSHSVRGPFAAQGA